MFSKCSILIFLSLAVLSQALPHHESGENRLKHSVSKKIQNLGNSPEEADKNGTKPMGHKTKKAESAESEEVEAEIIIVTFEGGVVNGTSNETDEEAWFRQIFTVALVNDLKELENLTGRVYNESKVAFNELMVGIFFFLSLLFLGNKKLCL